MLLNSHISAYATYFAWKVCGLVRPTWGTSRGEDKFGARDKILNTKVARRANIPPWDGRVSHGLGLNCLTSVTMPVTRYAHNCGHGATFQETRVA